MSTDSTDDKPASVDAKRAPDPSQMQRTMSYLAAHNVPPTPHNYALWFEYANGGNPELRGEIDRLIAAGTPFTAELNQTLYKRYIQDCSLADNEALQQRISTILNDLTRSLHHMGNQAGDYDRHLQQHISEIQRCDGLQDLGELLQVLADETMHMRSTTQQLEQQFEEKTAAIDDLQQELLQVKKAATSDPLTGLPNRRALLSAMQDLAADSGPGRHSLMMIDIDYFKEVNDQHGHLIGDRVIRYVADVIRNNIKGQDTPCRYGGEEYAVLLPNTPLIGAIAVAEAIRKAIAAALLVRSNKEPIGRITVSIGIGSSRNQEDSLELIERADQALYLAKSRGRNRVVPETELT